MMSETIEGGVVPQSIRTGPKNLYESPN